MTGRSRGGITVIHGTLDPASDPDGYAWIRRRGPSVLTIGKFDGVHRAHQVLLSRTRAEALRRGMQAGVVTFDVHPQEVLHSADVGYLTTPEERVELFADAGMEFVLLLRATRELFSTEAADFWASLVSGVDCRAIVVGANFRFGRGAGGDVTTLTSGDRTAHVQAIIVDLLADLGHVVSSSRIRQELEAGRVDRAADLLGRPFSVAGLLEDDNGQRWLVKVPSRTALPAPGGYSARVVFTGLDVPVSQPAVVIVRASGHRIAQLHVMPHSGLIWPVLHGQPVRVIFGQRQPKMLSSEHHS
jgi:riboflavin kinase/FMN adenylyltransferase